MTNPFITCPTPEVWRALLANPEKHWRDGYSAKELAMSWLHADGFPPRVESVLRRSLHFHDIEMLLGVPEHRVSLPGRGFDSQNDLWVLAQAGGRFVSIAVEGKVEEQFDETVGKSQSVLPSTDAFGTRNWRRFSASALQYPTKSATNWSIALHPPSSRRNDLTRHMRSCSCTPLARRTHTSATSSGLSGSTIAPRRAIPS